MNWDEGGKEIFHIIVFGGSIIVFIIVTIISNYKNKK